VYRAAVGWREFAWRSNIELTKKGGGMTAEGTATEAPQTDEEKTGALVERLMEAALGSVDIASVYVGDRMGLYRALTEEGPLTSAGLASRAGIHERYAREWLEQQAVTGILDVDDAGKPQGERRYSLSAAHAEALTKPDSLYSIAPLARAFVASIQALPLVMQAFESGGGVLWSAYGPDMIESQGDSNRAWVVNLLGSEYLPSIPDIHDRLRSDPPARVADVACGVGWASIAIALAYPNARVDGFDPDESSIEIARRLAKEAGVDDRVRFEVRDGAAIGDQGPYDLAIVIESIHDMARPVEVLAGIRKSLAPDGTLIVADEKVGEAFTAPGDALERLMYGFSFLVCLPAGMVEQPSAATGTVMRPDTLRSYAKGAGFGDVEILEQIPHDFLRFYRLTPPA
jgi:2-polyprenyl-3-methyl-5-hydroxy-6-metoxy-1,4-benzoquinol methylase